MERKKKSATARMCFHLVAICTFWLSTPAAAEPDPWPVTLRQQIARLTEVGYRIAVVAAPLCPSQAAGTGIGLDYIEAYDTKDRQAVSQLLHMSDMPQIAAVATGSPAALAGVAPGDDVLAIGGTPVAKLLHDTADRTLFADELEQRIAATKPGAQIELELNRDGRTVHARIAPRQICSSRFVLKTGVGLNAFSDGTNVAVASKLIGFSRNDDELALIAAHEIGHVINRDGDASDLAERRAMEDRADLMGVRLMKCAGYDPESGVQFWLRLDQKDWLRLLRSPSHRSKKERVALMQRDAAIASCPPSGAFDTSDR